MLPVPAPVAQTSYDRRAAAPGPRDGHLEVRDVARRFAGSQSACDSHRLNCLLGLQWLLARRNGALLPAGPSSSLLRVLELPRNSYVLADFPTVNAALAYAGYRTE